jgi:DNA-binding transcriptional regulator YhcF (GntR family)
MAHSPSLRAPAPDIGRDDDVPVGTQLFWRLRALIMSGRLAAGERLPGVRELAAGAGVNVNTARALYRRLEEEGLTVSRHGSGTFVAEGAAAQPFLEQLVAEAEEAARAHGIQPRDLARTLYVGSEANDPGLASGSGDEIDFPLPADDVDELPARRALRAQIARLEAELAPYTEHLELEDAPPPVSEPVGRVAGVGELEATRDRLAAQLREVHARARQTGSRQQAARARLDEMVRDPSAHKWEAISNEELGEPGCTTYEVRPAWGPVGALMNWWQVRVSGGCPLAGPREAAAG